MLIRTCYSQYSLPKQLVKFSQQVTEILPKFPHLLKNIRPVFFTEKYTQIQLWGCCTILHSCRMGTEIITTFILLMLTALNGKYFLNPVEIL